MKLRIKASYRGIKKVGSYTNVDLEKELQEEDDNGAWTVDIDFKKIRYVSHTPQTSGDDYEGNISDSLEFLSRMSFKYTLLSSDATGFVLAKS